MAKAPKRRACDDAQLDAVGRSSLRERAQCGDELTLVIELKRTLHDDEVVDVAARAMVARRS